MKSNNGFYIRFAKIFFRKTDSKFYGKILSINNGNIKLQKGIVTEMGIDSFFPGNIIRSKAVPNYPREIFYELLERHDCSKF